MQKIPTPLELMRELVIEAIRGRTSISIHDLGDLAGTLRSEAETAGWQIDDRTLAGAWSFDIPCRSEARPPEVPADAKDPPLKVLAYSSAEHVDGTLRVSYADGKCYQHEMLSGVWHRRWLDDGAVVLLHQVILGRYRARKSERSSHGNLFNMGERHMGEVSIDENQVILAGGRSARSNCGLHRGDPWYSVEVCVGVDGFSVVEAWRRGPCHPGDKTSYRLEASEVPVDVRCVALAVVAMG